MSEYNFVPKFSEFVTYYTGLVDVWIGDGTLPAGRPYVDSEGVTRYKGGTAGYLYGLYDTGAIDEIGFVSDYEKVKTFIPGITYEQWAQLLANVPQDVLDAEGWANGTHNGTAVDSSDKAYNKNALYYKNLAKDWATKSTDVEEGLASAKTYAERAGSSATSAANSATASANSASAASISESNAANSASAAATSESNSASSASIASAKASEAANSASSAETSASQAATSASNAQISATTAENQASSAANSASEASTQASNAAASASTAGTKASEASTSASNAATSEASSELWATGGSGATYSAGNSAKEQADRASTEASNAANSASSASSSATNAGLSENAAFTSATNANASEQAAAGSATNAATSASNAAVSASNAAQSENNAAGYESGALAAQTGAETAQSAAEAAQSAAEAAQTAAELAQQKVEAAIVHSPRINSNDNWEIWNFEDEQYEDTGHHSIAEATVEYDYQNSQLGTEVPTGTWSSTPDPQNGMFMWCRMKYTWTNGGIDYFYNVTYVGVNGTGSVNSVNGLGGDVYLYADNIKLSNTDNTTILQKISNIDTITDAQIDALFP